MASYNFFGATADDVLRRLPGDMAGTSHSAVEAAMADAETRVEAALPDRYRRLLSRVEGEVAVAEATEGQLSAALALPAASNLVLYADYTGLYADRKAADAMDASAYALGEGGGTVTFSPGLNEGTRIVADYDTTLSDGVPALASLVALLAAATLARRACYGRPEWAESLAAEADARLAALADGRTAVPTFDAIALYEDWERPGAGIRIGSLERA